MAKPWVTLHAQKPFASAPWHYAKFCIGENHTDPSRVVCVFIGQRDRRDTCLALDLGATQDTIMEHDNLEALGLVQAGIMGFTQINKTERGLA